MRLVGFGLAGACVALQCRQRGIQVTVKDEGEGSSLVAAGLVNPVAGRNFEPSWKVSEYWPEALEFYRKIEAESGVKFFHERPIFRLWFDEKDRAKFEKKRELLEEWILEVKKEGVIWRGGGWLDTKLFLKVARELVDEFQGRFLDEEVRCTGARGLREGEFSEAHRCAKGEMLTIRATRFEEERILNRGGWLIPLGNGVFRAGATYDWDGLDTGPTDEGRQKVEQIVKSLGCLDFEVIDHVAGVRPIISRSIPVRKYEKGRGWFFNGLGSKGVIYAPGEARRLMEEMEEMAD